MPFVIVLEGKNRGQRFELGDRAIVGRGEGVGVQLADTAISRQHARIYRNGDLYQTLNVPPQAVLGRVLRLVKAVWLDLTGDSFFTVEAGVALDANGAPLSPGLVADVQEIEPEIVPLAFTNPIFVDQGADGYTPPGL